MFVRYKKYLKDRSFFCFLSSFVSLERTSWRRKMSWIMKMMSHWWIDNGKKIKCISKMKVTDINLQDRRIFSCDRICKVHCTRISFARKCLHWISFSSLNLKILWRLSAERKENSKLQLKFIAFVNFEVSLFYFKIIPLLFLHAENYWKENSV